MLRLCLQLVLFLNVWLCVVPSALAQTTGTIRGTVTDAQGAVLPSGDASIRLPFLRRPLHR